MCHMIISGEMTMYTPFLKAHIPQIDGVGDNNPDDETFCKICKEWHEETKTSEDLNFHVMNNHEIVDVFQAYGQEWVETRRLYSERISSPWHVS